MYHTPEEMYNSKMHDNPKEGDYRIITDGNVFRIEKFQTTGFLWWKKSCWRVCGTEDPFDGYFEPREFKSKKDAQGHINRQIKIGTKTLWEPVS